MIKWVLKPYVIIGIGVGVGVVTCVIRVLRQNKDEIVQTQSNRINRAIKIPKGFVGHVLGRNGSTIKGIREKSRARISFDDTDKEFTVATVRGTVEEVEEAITLINSILTSRHACITKEITLQENITDSIWKNVHYIRQICDITHVKTIFEFMPSRSKEPNVKIILKGRKEEVEAASELIDELVAEVEVNSNKQFHVAGRALPQNLPLQINSFMNRNLPCEKLIPNSSDGFLEVYVSAVDNPNKFWVQISGSKSIQLDKLATEMTDFYNEDKNKERFQLNSISVGDIVSAFFQGDNSWYRAQVVKVSDEEDKEKKISVFYLDFGDCAVLSPTLVNVLKPDFLSIPFQAIACSLSSVAPLNGEWTQEASEEFEKMVYLGQWKVIMAKPVKQCKLETVEVSSDSVELVQLLDTNTDEDIDIGSELIKKGFAKRV